MSCANETFLLQRLIEGNHSAWTELVKKYSGLLLGISRRTFASYGFEASSHDCEDAVAEVWRNLLHNDREQVRRCLDRGQLLPTLHVLTRNRSIDVMRRRKFVTVPIDEVEEIAFSEVGSETEVELSPSLPQALAQLSARERTLVELFFLQGKKYREIELLLGIPQNSIGPTLKRAVAKLRKSIFDCRKESYAIQDEP